MPERCEPHLEVLHNVYLIFRRLKLCTGNVGRRHLWWSYTAFNLTHRFDIRLVQTYALSLMMAYTYLLSLSSAEHVEVKSDCWMSTVSVDLHMPSQCLLINLDFQRDRCFPSTSVFSLEAECLLSLIGRVRAGLFNIAIPSCVIEAKSTNGGLIVCQ